LTKGEPFDQAYELKLELKNQAGEVNTVKEVTARIIILEETEKETASNETADGNSTVSDNDAAEVNEEMAEVNETASIDAA